MPEISSQDFLQMRTLRALDLGETLRDLEKTTCFSIIVKPGTGLQTTMKIHQVCIIYCFFCFFYTLLIEITLGPWITSYRGITMRDKTPTSRTSSELIPSRQSHLDSELYFPREKTDFLLIFFIISVYLLCQLQLNLTASFDVFLFRLGVNGQREKG